MKRERKIQEKNTRYESYLNSPSEPTFGITIQGWGVNAEQSGDKTGVQVWAKQCNAADSKQHSK